MNWTLYLLFSVSSIVAGYGNFPVSKFYEDTFLHEYNCSFQFDQPRFLDCACVTGLWILYESCSENFTITGDDTFRCTRLSGAPISKAVQVVSARDELALLAPTGAVTLLKPENVGIYEVFSDWAFITGSDWTLIDTSGTRICLSVIDPDSYCFFSNKEGTLEINTVEKGCDKFDYFLDPQKCEPVGEEDENICDYVFESSSPIHRMVKRNADPNANASPPASGAAGNSSDANSIAITEEDEDYLIAQAQANSTTGNGTAQDPTAIIADGILDFMDSMLDDLLGFHHTTSANEASTTPAPVGTTSKPVPITEEDSDAESTSRRRKNVNMADKLPDEEFTNSSNLNPLNITYSNPPYEFLEISKRITQKTCPSFYVKPEFLNLAVATFIRLQQVDFKFPETSFKPAGFRRVLENLRKCEQYASQFNFTDADCDGKVDGNYTAYGKTIELTVTAEYANFDRDPIIESVWKVFFNAHSYCYPFFNKTLDHHRFTTWMIPLFQNQVNDIWTAGKTTEHSLNGLFGNQIQVQGNLAYCAVSSRLESAYPFDLPRPARVPEYGPPLAGTPTGSGNGTAAGRRKRDLGYMSLFTDNKPGNCLETSKPLLCPDHVKSIVNSI